MRVRDLRIDRKKLKRENLRNFILNGLFDVEGLCILKMYLDGILNPKNLRNYLTNNWTWFGNFVDWKGERRIYLDNLEEALAVEEKILKIKPDFYEELTKIIEEEIEKILESIKKDISEIDDNKERKKEIEHEVKYWFGDSGCPYLAYEDITENILETTF